MAKKGGHAVLVVIAFVTMFLFGFVENLKGVSYPLIKAEFGVPYDDQGGMIALTWFGYVAFTLVASFFLQRFGTKRALTAGYLALIGGALAVTVSPTFLAVAAALVFLNFGYGFFEVGTNALGMAVFTSRTALLMSLLHFFYGLGSILGPKFAGVLTADFGLGWRQVYLAAIVPLAACGLFLAFSRFDGSRVDAFKGKITYLQALRMPTVWILALTLGFMEVVEFSASNWGGLYLQDVFGMDVRTAGAAFVSSFYILFTLSRLVSGFAVEKAGYLRSLYVAAAALLAVYVAGFLMGCAGIPVLATSGFFIAILWPTMMSVIAKAFGDEAPIVSSAVITLSGAINGIFQWVVGLTDQYVGKAWGMRSDVVYAALILVLLAVLSRRLKTERSL